MNKHLLVISWKGRGIDSNIVANIAQYLVDAGVSIPELITTIYKDDEGILSSTKKIDGKANLTIPLTKLFSVENESIKQAVIFIGEKYRKLLNQESTLVFACLLTKDANSGYVNIGTEESAALLNALKIIANADHDELFAYINSNRELKKYHFTMATLTAIKQVYNLFTV